jgi:hypothetical protein
MSPLFDRDDDRPHRLAVFLDGAYRLLHSPATKLVLSFLIVLSVLPARTVASLLPSSFESWLDVLFLCLFGPEFALRTAAFVRARRRGQASRWEPVLLAADFMALLSFLPLRDVFRETRSFRIFRLTRLLLLLGYWGEMVVDLWAILTGKERRAPVVFVVLLGLVLSFTGAVILGEFAPPFDYDGNGRVDDTDRSFGRILWWSFRQVQDSGNLAVEPSGALVVTVSLALTGAGLLLLTFLIGISTGAMEELLRRARNRPLGLRSHLAILGLGPYSIYLLNELAEIYRKRGRAARAAVLGREKEPPPYFHQKRLATLRYRAGDPARVEDLDRVDVGSAKRILVLGPGGDNPDATVISTILAARTRNRSASLFADLEHERNLMAARTAGGADTHPIGSGPFLGHYVAQNVIYPGVYRAYRQLLTTAGPEIDTYFFTPAERRGLAALDPLDPAALLARARRRHGVTLLGLFVDVGEARNEAPRVLLNPTDPESRLRHPQAFTDGGRLRASTVAGLVGIGQHWPDLAQAARAIASGDSPETMTDVPGFERLELRFPAGPVRRVVVCGSSSRVPRVVTELLLFYGPLDVTVLVRDEANVGSLQEAIQAALEGNLSGLPRGAASSWVPDEEEGCRMLRITEAGGEARIRVMQADWSDASRFLRHPAADLSAADAILFLPREGADDADGLVALDCLRIAQFGTAGLLRFQAGLRVVGLVRDPVKCDLLESRLDEMAGPGAEARFTIVSSERVRHHFLVRHVFVRGLGSVFLELLGATGQHLCRLVPEWGADSSDGDFDPWELYQHLLVGRGLLLLGLERASAGGRPQLDLDPRHMGPGQRVARSSIAALYVLGNGRALLGATTGSTGDTSSEAKLR